MTESTTPRPPDEPKADETFTWTQTAASPGAGGSAAASLLESVRDAVDDLAERAAPVGPRVLGPGSRARRDRRRPRRARWPSGPAR